MESDSPEDPKAEGSKEAEPGASGAQGQEVDIDAIRDKVDRLFDLVPQIGTRWRWYEFGYRPLRWLFRVWPRPLKPRWLSNALVGGMNFLDIQNQLERARVEPLDDPRDNLIVPPESHVLQGGIWAIEFFPPSKFSELIKSLQRNGWDRASRSALGDEPPSKRIEDGRRGKGYWWSRITTVADPNYPNLVPDGIRETLPREFGRVELSHTQIGDSLTAVMAFFVPSEIGRKRLDSVWHSKHEPRLVWRRPWRRPNLRNRLFQGIYETQMERQRIHDLARQWMSQRCAGFFASTELGQPVLDFNLFEELDLDEVLARRDEHSVLRALGMEGDTFRQFTSPQIPAIRLVPPPAFWNETHPLRNCWGLVGHYDGFVEGNTKPGYGEPPFAVTTCASMIDRQARSFLVYTATERYLQELRSSYARARDYAHTKHGRFSASKLNELRADLLTTSLDLPVVARDLGSLWDARYQRWMGINVVTEPGPGNEQNSNNEQRRSEDVISSLGKRTQEQLNDLEVEDKSYRDVLVSVASLGSSAQASRLGRIALTLAGASLLVVTATLLLVESDGETLGSRLVDWIATWWP